MSADGNPWLPPRVAPDEGESSAPPPQPVTPPWQRPQLDAEAGGVPQPTRRLGWWQCPAARTADVAWWAVGVHGGAGATRLVAATGNGGHDIPQHWPVVPSGRHSLPLLLVARTDLHGLLAAQDAVREWWWKLTPPGFDLAGLVLMSDAPGKLPASLRDLARALSGAVPRLWHIPWVPEWRTGEVPNRLPKELGDLQTHLQGMKQPDAPAGEADTGPDWTPERSSA
ncbi:MAG: DUF6668 family protein [Streptosporangiales bacterium]